MSAFPKLDPLPDQPVQTDIHLCPGLFVKHCTFASDTYIPQHAHAFDHLSVIATGAVEVWADGEFMGVHRAPAGIHIVSHVKHMFRAIEDNTTVLCVHRVDASGDVEIEAEHRLGDT